MLPRLLSFYLFWIIISTWNTISWTCQTFWRWLTPRPFSQVNAAFTIHPSPLMSPRRVHPQPPQLSPATCGSSRRRSPCSASRGEPDESSSDRLLLPRKVVTGCRHVPVGVTLPALRPDANISQICLLRSVDYVSISVHYLHIPTA